MSGSQSALKLQELTDGDDHQADQVKRFLEAINARGHNMTSLNKRAVAQALANKPDDYVRQLLELRRDRSARQREQVQADAVLRIASRRSHARHVAHVRRSYRSLVAGLVRNCRT